MATSYSSESLEEKFTKPLLRMVVGCLDIMMPRKNGKSATTEVGLPKYNFDDAISAIKSGVLYYKHELDTKSILMSAETSAASQSAVSSRALESSPFSSPARRVGGSPSRITIVKQENKEGEQNVKSEQPEVQKIIIHRVRWDQLKQMIFSSIDCKHAEISAEIEAERNYFEMEEAAVIAKHKLKCFQSAISHLPSVLGKWNKAASELRRYQNINEYIPTENVSADEKAEILSILETPLKTAYLGQSYNFDDCALTEEWMCTFADKRTGKTLPEEDIIKVLTSSTLDMICEQVKDRVCSQSGVLDADPLNLRMSDTNTDLANLHENNSDAPHYKYCVEQPVFGIDCACRRLIEVVLLDRLGEKICTPFALKFFIERKLLPIINKLPGKFGHSMLKALECLCDTMSCDNPGHNNKSNLSDNRKNEHIDESVDEKCLYSMATTLLACVKELGIENFKIHPKGSGVVCVHPEGIAPHQVVCEYLGELYPPYRWCERQAVVEQAQKRFKLKPALPDFYNILLERPREDPRGYGLLFVDASEHANLGSTLSHSCDSNCTSAVVSRNGRLSIVLTSTRFIYCGEELTHDYAAVTSSEDEWKSAVCLCGMSRCRGSFLHYTTQNDLQQILKQHCSPLYRFSQLLKACSNHPLSIEASEALSRHGMLDLALGRLSKSDVKVPLWACKFASDMLRFIEYERQALPCALMRQSNEVSPPPTASEEVILKQGRQDEDDNMTTAGTPLSPKTEKCTNNLESSRMTFETSYALADMDARSVMEQRVQSLCCAFSMTQRFFSRQLTNTTSSAQAASQFACAEDKKPLELLDASSSVRFLLDIVEEIPALMRQYLLKKNSDSDSSTSYTKNLKQAKIGHSGEEALINGGGDDDDDDDVKKKQKEAKERDEEIQGAIRKISSIVTTFGFIISAPSAKEEKKGISAVHMMILEVRKIVLSIVDYSTRRARLRQLADVLGLLAHTYTFARPVKFLPLHSEPISVPCRELGTNIRRCDLAIDNAHGLGIHKDKSKSAKTKMKDRNGKDRDKDLIPPSELVYTGTKRYGAYFAFEQMMGWYTAGEDGAGGEVRVSVDSDGDVETGNHHGENGEGRSKDRYGANEKKGNHKKELKSSISGQKSAVGSHTPAKKMKKEKDVKKAEGKNGNTRKEKLNDRGTYDLFGSAQIPRPWQCFGQSISNYSTKQRGMLLDILRNERLQCLPWPESLFCSFNHREDLLRAELGEGEVGAEDDTGNVDTGDIEGSLGDEHDHENEEFWKARVRVFGSPMLDVSLGKTQAVKEALHEISEKDAKANRNSLMYGHTTETMDMDQQLDERLPPEANSQWVQCDRCHRWRRLPFHVDIESLDDDWTCDKNTWEPEKASCAAPPDDWDPDTEDIADFDGGKGENTPPKVGDWRDVFCPRNLVYYEGQILKIREATNPSSMLVDGNSAGDDKDVRHIDLEYYVHFKGFKKGFDEWVRASSDRIRPHNMFTSVLAKTVAEQQAYQGMHVASKSQKRKFAKEKDDAKKRKKKEEENAKKKEGDAGRQKKKSRTTKHSKTEHVVAVAPSVNVTSLSAEYDALVSTDDESEAETSQKKSIAVVTLPLSTMDLDAQYDALDSDSDS